MLYFFKIRQAETERGIAMVKRLKFCMAGFGNVGTEFCRLLLDKRQELNDDFGYEILMTGVTTRSKGMLIDNNGLDIENVLSMNDRLGHFDKEDSSFRAGDAKDMLDACESDLFIELTTLSIKDGEPAASYIEKAFSKGMHVITANKGPEAWHFKKLKKKSEEAGTEFLYETIVMDGTPLFNMARETLRGNKINKIRGVLNSTSNFVLSRIECGESVEEAIITAQNMKIAEKDPSFDMEGGDGAAKICAMVNILMDAEITPATANVEPLNVTKHIIDKAKQNGFRIKYVCSAERVHETGTVKISVKQEELPAEDILAHINGTSSAATLYTDLAGEISIIQSNPGILQTAYGIYSDLTTLLNRIK